MCKAKDGIDIPSFQIKIDVSTILLIICQTLNESPYKKGQLSVKFHSNSGLIGNWHSTI